MRIKSTQKFVVAFMAVSTFLCLAGVAMADPFLNYPGTRARAMGGAFTAIASDASAIWYNPAGLALKGSDVIAEVSNSVEYSDESGEFENTDTTFFLAGKWADGTGGGMGLAFYEPYFLNGNIGGIETDSGDIIFGNLIEDMNIFAWGFAGSFGEEKNFRLGGTVEYVWVNYTDSALYKNTLSDPIDLEDTGFDLALSGSVGALYTLPLQPFGIMTNLGATYRLKSYNLTESYEFDGAEVTLSKPSSWDAGISFAKSITPIYSTLTVSAQRGNTDYGSMNDNFVDYGYDKTSFGAELVYSKEFLFFKDIALRLGTYKSEPDLDNYDGTIKGTSWGVATRIGESLALEVASETRDYFGEYDVELQSFAATWSF